MFPVELTKAQSFIVYASKLGYKVLEDGSLVSPSGKPLNPSPDTYGYLKQSVKFEGKVRKLYVHRLQAYQKFGCLMFQGRLQVRHMDSDQRNNASVNIELGTPRQNILDKPKSVRCAAAKKAHLTRKRNAA